MHIGDNIRILRKECNLTQNQLASNSGVSLRSISYYENGLRIPTDDAKVKLSKALRVDLNELTDLSKYRNIYNSIENQRVYSILITLKNCEDMEGTVKVNEILDKLQNQGGVIKSSTTEHIVTNNQKDYSTDIYRFITILYYSDEELRV